MVFNHCRLSYIKEKKFMYYLVTVLTDENVTVEELLEPFGVNSKVTNREVLFTKEELISEEKMNIWKAEAEYRKASRIKGITDKEKERLFYQIEKLEQLEKASREEIYQYAIQWYSKELITPEGGVYKSYNPYARWSSYRRDSENVKILVVEDLYKKGSYTRVSSAKLKDIQWDLLRYGNIPSEVCIMPDGTWYYTNEGCCIKVNKNDRKEITLNWCDIGECIIKNDPEWTVNIVECYM